jgi:hypothetical protein
MNGSGVSVLQHSATFDCLALVVFGLSTSTHSLARQDGLERAIQAMHIVRS